MEISEEARRKAAETRANGLKQIALPEETETHINVDYNCKIICIDTNKATVMNRLERVGILYNDEEILSGEVFNRRYILPFSDMAKVIKVGLFK